MLRSSILTTALFSGLVSAAAVYTNSSTLITAFSSSTVYSSSRTGSAAVPSRSCLYPSNPADGTYGNWEDSDCMRPGDPVVNVGAYNIYKYEASWDPVMSSSCSSQFESSLSSWEATAPITSFGFTATDEEGKPVQTESYVQYVDFFTFAPPTGCCLNCTLYGGNVQVYYWPTPAPTPAVSTLVNDVGFTFVSPSVYVAFQSLYATDLCGAVGPTYNSTTIGFEPDELKTAMAFSWSGTSPVAPYIPNNFTVADWGEFDKNCTNYTSTFIQDDLTGVIYTDPADIPSSCSDSPCYLDGFTITWDPCSPTLSVPTQLFSINTLWTGCMQGIDAFYDPPYTLTSGSGLHAPVVTAPADPVTTTNAQPASTPISPVASITTTIIADPVITTPTSPVVVDPVTSTSQVIVDPTTSTTQVIIDPPTSTQAAADPATSTQAVADPATSTQDPATSNPPPETTTSAPQNPVNNDPTTAPTSTSTSAAPGDPASSQSSAVDPGDPTTPIVIASQTLTPGGPAATISGTTYSVPSSATAIIINGQTSSLPPQFTPASSPPSPITTPIIIASQTLTPGGPAVTISGTTFSIPTSATAIIVNGQTSALPSAAAPSAAGITIGTQTLTPGGAATISGSTYSLPTSGGVIVVNGQTSSLPPSATVKPASISEYIIGSSTLTPGGVLTVSGTTYSLPTSGADIVIDGTTQAFVKPGSSTYIIGSQTLVAGSSGITVSGTVVSLMSGGSSVVLIGNGGTQTTTEDVGGFLGATSTGGIGGVIISVGGFLTPTVVPTSTAASGNGTAPFTGAAGKMGMSEDLKRCIVTGCILWLGILGVGVL